MKLNEDIAGDTQVTGESYSEEQPYWRKFLAHPAILLIMGVVIFGFATQLTTTIYQSIMPLARGPVGGFPPADYLIILTIVVVLVYAFFVYFIEDRSLTELGPKGAWREWLFGVLLGGGAISVVIGVIALLGGYRVIDFNSPMVLVYMSAVAIQSGIVEEILFRGLLFRLMEKWLGSAFALLLSAALFGFAHLGNENSSWFAAIAIAIEAGIMLGAVYMFTRRLWAAIGLHMAWNFAQGGIFGVAVSGHDIPGLIVSAPYGPDLISGGAFGAEASLPAIFIATALGLYLLYVAIKKGHYVKMSMHRFKTGMAAPS